MRGYWNLPYQDDRTYTYPALPVPLLIASPVSVSQISLTATISATVTVINWTFERALSASGPWTIIGIQGSPILANTGLSPSTTYFYRVKAFTSSGYMTSYSSVQSATTPSQSSAIKWNPGHYAESDTVVKGAGQIATCQGEIDLMAGLPNVLGYMVIVSWGTLQQAQGVYTWDTLDAIVNYCTNRTPNGANTPKRWAITINPGNFNGRFPGTNEFTYIPQYIKHGSTATWGNGGGQIRLWPISGTITSGSTSGSLSGAWVAPTGSHSCTFPDSGDVRTVNFVNGSTTITWSGATTADNNGNLTISTFTFNQSGEAGWWGGDATNTYSAALWRPAITEEFNLLYDAIGDRYDSDPFFEMTYHIENSFIVGCGSNNGDGSYNDTNMENEGKTWCSRAAISHPTTNVAYSNTFLRTTAPCQDLTNWMMTTTSPTLAHAVNMGQTDSLGLLTGGSGHTGSTGARSDGARAYVGAAPPIPDFRPKRLFMAEVQAPDQGFFVDIGSPREDILDALNNLYQATHAYWAIVPRGTTPAGAGTVPWPITWTVAPGIGATSGTMASPWRLQSGSYTITFTGGSKTGTFAQGSTTVTWSGGLTTAQGTAEQVTVPLTPMNWWNGSSGNAGPDGLAAFLNNPANALIHTAYPDDYP